MAVKRVLVAHQHAAVRDRFAAALADARHEYVTAASESEARRAARVHLAILDLQLAPEGAAFVRAVRAAAGGPVPALAFAGSVRSAAEIPALDDLGVRFINEHAATAQILPALAPHLFPDSFNRRATARVAVQLPVSYRTGATIAGAMTLDLSKGGLGIRTMSPLPKDTSIHVKFRLPGADADVQASGRVSWIDRRVGMGVQFDEVSSNDQRALDAFIDAHV
jgi:uncharacterized protein (TIGR02266 family)